MLHAVIFSPLMTTTGGHRWRVLRHLGPKSDRIFRILKFLISSNFSPNCLHCSSFLFVHFECRQYSRRVTSLCKHEGSKGKAWEEDVQVLIICELFLRSVYRLWINGFLVGNLVSYETGEGRKNASHQNIGLLFLPVAIVWNELSKYV